MSARQPWEPLDAPLQGRVLVEASAGTGKTYSIASLFIRLVVEKALPVDRILVMTFTNDATAELRDRIRARLLAAHAAVVAGASDDPFLAHLLARLGGAAAREQAALLLLRARHDFDRHAITTIHGFCERVLRRHPFLCGTPFAVRLAPDDAALLRDAALDFWRSHARDNPQPPAGLIKLAREVERLHGSLCLAGGETDADPAPAAAAYQTAWSALHTALAAHERPVRTALATAINEGALKKNIYSTEKVARVIEEVLATGPRAPGELPAKLELLGAAKLFNSACKGQQPPHHHLFALADQALAAHTPYATALQQHRVHLDRLFCEGLPARLESIKDAAGVQTFQDLLVRVHRAVAQPALRQLLQDQYPAALIDEFQDTDPLQCGIVDALYGGPDAGGRALFLIGDPKQSIYRFRGADLHAYLAAADTVDRARQFSLAENWRSVPGLVAGVQALWQGHPDPFGQPGITLPAVRPAPAREGDRRVPLQEDGDAGPPLRFWLAPDSTGHDAWAAEAVAQEIARLVAAGRAGRARLGDRPLHAGDLAVLVLTHAQGEQVYEALAGLRIPAVRSGDQPVTRSDEARELALVFEALHQPGDERLLRAALMTRLLGWHPADVARLGGEATAWEATVQRFRSYAARWRERGFMACFQDLLAGEGIAARLATDPRGERRLTNLRHLAELLHRAARERAATPADELAWLRAAQDGGADDEGAPEERALRLESDEQRVRIVTVHGAKGLEYPVVFCPFHARPPKAGKLPFRAHGPNDEQVLVLEDQDKTYAEAAAHEALAEGLRVLYVALTRAASRCYVAASFGRDYARSPLAHVLRHTSPESRDAVAANLRDLAAKHPASIAFEEAPQAGDTAAAAMVAAPPAFGPARRWSRAEPIERSWRITSFSDLIALAPAGDDEEREYDESGSDAPADAEHAGNADLPLLPGGRGTGTLVHQVLETLPFDAPRADVRDAVAAALPRFGMETDLADPFTGLLAALLATPLDADGLRLRDLAPADRLHELAFHLPLANWDPAAFRAALQHAAPGSPLARNPAWLGALPPGPLKGFLKGSIDLVFRRGGRFSLADYKTNYLGRTAPAYAREGLPAAMAGGRYFLQYHLYTLALHRHLATALGPRYDYARDVGGVFYLFARGMDPASGPGRGVFFDRPAPALIEALSNLFPGGGP